MSEMSLPHWLQPPATTTAPQDPTTPTRADLARLQRENRLALYESALQPILERMTSSNMSFYDAVRDSPFEIDPVHMLQWVMRDEKRKADYYEAQAIAAEGIAQDMIRIADAEDTVEDVERSKLKISTRKWLLGVWNRKRFGDVKQIEQNVTVDMGAAMAEASERVARLRASTRDVIDVEVR